MKLIKFDADHAVELVSQQLNDDRNRPSFGLKAYEHLTNSDTCKSGVVNGHLIFSAGIVELWPGVGEAWLLASAQIEKHKVAVARSVKTHFAQIADAYDLHRVQAHMKSDWPELSRWAAFLGMQHEGTIRQMTPLKENYELYSWVKNGN